MKTATEKKGAVLNSNLIKTIALATLSLSCGALCTHFFLSAYLPSDNALATSYAADIAYPNDELKTKAMKARFRFTETFTNAAQGDNSGEVHVEIVDGTYDGIHLNNHLTITKYQVPKYNTKNITSYFKHTFGNACPDEIEITTIEGKDTFRMFNKDGAEAKKEHYYYENVETCVGLASKFIFFGVNSIIQYQAQHADMRKSWDEAIQKSNESQRSEMALVKK